MSNHLFPKTILQQNYEQQLTYKQSGVDIQKGDSFVEAIKDIAKYKDIKKISENAILYVKENNSLENLIESEYKSMIKLN